MKSLGYRLLIAMTFFSLAKAAPALAQVRPPAAPSWTMSPTENGNGAVFTFSKNYSYLPRTSITISIAPVTGELNFVITRPIRFDYENDEIISLTWKADGTFVSGKHIRTYIENYRKKNRETVLKEDNYINHSIPATDANLIHNAYASVKSVIVEVANKRPISESQAADFLLNSYLVAQRNVAQIYLGYTIDWFSEMRPTLEKEAGPFRCLLPMNF
jgi:hypothetical protein